MEGLRKKSGIWWKMWFFPHFNTKPQILKSSLFYGEARLWMTCEHVLVCLGPTITTGTRSQGWSMPLIYSVRHHHAGGHRRFSAGWSAGSLLAPGCLGKGGSAWTSSWDWLYSVCTFLTSHGTSVLLVNYRPRRTSKTSCRSNLFWVGGQRMVPCPWPEQHNHHFLSHRVSLGCSSTGQGFQFCTSENGQRHQKQSFQGPRGELPPLHVPVVPGLMQLQRLGSTLFVLWQNRRKYIARRYNPFIQFN